MIRKYISLGYFEVRLGRAGRLGRSLQRTILIRMWLDGILRKVEAESGKRGRREKAEREAKHYKIRPKQRPAIRRQTRIRKTKRNTSIVYSILHPWSPDEHRVCLIYSQE